MACDFTALVQSGNYSVVTLPAQPGNYLGHCVSSAARRLLVLQAA